MQNLWYINCHLALSPLNNYRNYRNIVIRGKVNRTINSVCVCVKLPFDIKNISLAICLEVFRLREPNTHLSPTINYITINVLMLINYLCIFISHSASINRSTLINLNIFILMSLNVRLKRISSDISDYIFIKYDDNLKLYLQYLVHIFHKAVQYKKM